MILKSDLNLYNKSVLFKKQQQQKKKKWIVCKSLLSFVVILYTNVHLCTVKVRSGFGPHTPDL